MDARLMARSSAETWLEAGAELLRSEGQDALSIDRLARQLGLTKGSFYHHFRDLDAYRSAFFERWREGSTEALVIQTGGRQSAARRLSRLADLADLARLLDVRLDVAVRAWGLRDARVAETVRVVDARRVAYLESLWRERCPPALARRVASLQYATYLGAQQLYGDLKSEGARTLEQTLASAIRALLREARR